MNKRGPKLPVPCQYGKDKQHLNWKTGASFCLPFAVWVMLERILLKEFLKLPYTFIYTPFALKNSDKRLIRYGLCKSVSGGWVSAHLVLEQPTNDVKWVANGAFWCRSSSCYWHYTKGGWVSLCWDCVDVYQHWHLCERASVLTADVLAIATGDISRPILGLFL